MNKLLQILVDHCNVVFLTGKTNCYTGKRGDGKRVVYINKYNCYLDPIKMLWGRPTIPYFTEAHEVGHAFFHKHRLEKDPEAQGLFGDFAMPYRGMDGLILSILHCPTDDYISNYAYEHPKEDFADCFAFLVSNNNVIPEDIDNETVRKKLRYIQKQIKQVRGKYH